MPRLLRQFVAVVVLSLIVAAMLNQAWNVSIATVLATTGVLGLVLGLALRPVLTDLFCGIALNVEQPFRLEDFVVLRMRGQREPVVGIVREINWRSTRVLTPQDNLIAVPNSLAAAAIVENLSFPSPVSEQQLEIVLDWNTEPSVIAAVLNAAVTEAWAQGATAGPKPPKVRITRLDGAGVTYRIVYLIDPRRRPKGPARHALLGCVQRHLQLAGLRPVAVLDTPSTSMHAGAQHPIDHGRADERARLLGQVPLFDVLDVAERAALAAAAEVRRMPAEAYVVHRGEPGASMFVVAAGAVEVLWSRTEGEEHDRIDVIGAGGVFGEMSMLTGAPRSAGIRTLTESTLYEAHSSAFAPILAARPALADALSRTMAEHLRRDAARLAAVEDADVESGRGRPGPAEQIAAHIRRFFQH